MKLLTVKNRKTTITLCKHHDNTFQNAIFNKDSKYYVSLTMKSKPLQEPKKKWQGIQIRTCTLYGLCL